MGDEGEKKYNAASKCHNKTKVIIIGAGMAGLSAANHLLKNGIDDFRIIEARKRIGGRIISIPLKHQKVELGANWIHGVLGNPIFEVAMANGLIDIIHIPKPHKVIAATEEGKQVPFGVLHEIYEAYVCFLRRCEEYFLCQYLPPPDIHSVGEHIDLEATLYLDKLPPAEKRLRRLIFDCLLKRETCISGCHSMSEIDLLELGSYTELQGGNIMLPSGYSSILGPMTKRIEKKKIVTGQPVKVINWNNSKASHVLSPAGDSGIEETGNESDDSDKTVIEELSKESTSRVEPVCEASSSGTQNAQNNFYVEVICENGERYLANHVICTVPLGVLKEKASTLFNPSLPEYKLESIERLLFGTVDKIFLEYDRPFLNPNITEIMMLWDGANEDNLDMDKKWFRKIYSFTKVSETLLLGWLSGKEAEYMENLSTDVVAAKCTEILRKFLNDPFVPEPLSCICTSWRNQTHSRGSYTAIAVGASQADIEHLAQPIYADPYQNKPVLLFAGEHTHSNFYSTVHGAYLSGRTAAQFILAPDEPREVVVECSETSDLSTWIQGISLE